MAITWTPLPAEPLIEADLAEQMGTSRAPVRQALQRLALEGLLEARWEEADGGRPRKVYRLTSKGRKRWDKVREQFVRVMGGALRAVENSAPGGAYEPAK